MMKIVLALCALSLVSASLGNPPDNALLLRQRRELNIFGNTRQLVEELIKNLRNSAQQALEAVQIFAAGIQDQGKQIREKIADDLKNLRQKVTDAIKNITDRFNGAGEGVRECVESQSKVADSIFADTIEKSKQCTDSRIQDVGNLIENLKEIALNASDYVNNAVSEMKECSDNGQGFLVTGTCLSGIAVRTELRGVIFITQSGLLISRINLALATLPASLEICAGTNLLAAGISSAKVLTDIGTCSASSIYSSLTGNNVSYDNLQ